MTKIIETTPAATDRLPAAHRAHLEHRLAVFVTEYEALSVQLLERGLPPRFVLLELDTLAYHFKRTLLFELLALRT